MKRASRFYREVLDTNDLAMLEAQLLTASIRRADSEIMDSTSDFVRIRFADRVADLREYTAYTLAAAMTDSLAALVVDEYFWHGEEHRVAGTSAENYAKKSRNLLARYCKKSGLGQVDELSPVTAVICLFEHTKQLKQESWSAYRSALLFAFRKTRLDQIRRSNDHRAYDRAIALLALVDEPPFDDERPAQETADRRNGVATADHEALFAQLKRSSVNRSVTALLFAMATLETGLRPSEWGDAQYVEHDPNDEGRRPALIIRTAKIGSGDDDKYRTLILTRPEVVSIVLAHMQSVSLEIEAADPDWLVPPLDNLIKKCSARIMEECKLLWPKNNRRRFTLYSFRHQAAADFKKAFGKAVAAAMLGHSEVVGSRNYAGMDRASKVRVMGVAPGLDVMERVKAMRVASDRRDEADKPWKSVDTQSKNFDVHRDVGQRSDEPEPVDQPEPT